MSAIAPKDWHEPVGPASAPSGPPRGYGQSRAVGVARSAGSSLGSAAGDLVTPVIPGQAALHRMSGRAGTHGTAGRSSRERRLYLTGGKRMLDVATASVLLAVLSPLLLAASIWIAVDARAHPLFLQQRIGRGGRGFTLLKLRTMTPAPTTRLVWFTDERGILRHKIRHDPRVTRPGRFLRRTSIDELPQLWNVLRGDMSLIGPRPELIDIVATYEPWQHARHAVRPGLTGWWQISGRSDSPMHEHTDLDIYYVDHLSFKLDVLIARKTIRVVLKGLGAF